MIKRRDLAIRIALALFAALVSVALTRVSSVPLLVADTTAPVPIWGPAIDDRLVAAILAGCVLGVLLARGWRWRIAAVLVWLCALAALTHRLVDGQDQTATLDRWLGLEVARLDAGRETDPAPAACSIGPFTALCITRDGRLLRTPTLVPFAPMVERADAPERLTARPRAR